MNTEDALLELSRADRSQAVVFTRDMVKLTTNVPGFKDGFRTWLRTEKPPFSVLWLAKFYERRGERRIAEMLGKLARIVRDHALTWAEIDGN